MRTAAYFLGGLFVTACLASAVGFAEETHPYGRFGARSLGGTLAPRERSRFEGGIQRSPSGSIIGLQRSHSRFAPSTPRARALEDFSDSLQWPPVPVDPRVRVDPRVPVEPREPRVPDEPRDPRVAPTFPRRLPNAQLDPRLQRVPQAREAPARVPVPRKPMPRVPVPREPTAPPAQDDWFRPLPKPDGGN